MEEVAKYILVDDQEKVERVKAGIERKDKNKELYISCPQNDNKYLTIWKQSK